MLFDEATSALDPENEAHVMRSIAELRKTSTVIVIAHKLDTIKAADEIVVVNGGHIEAIGTHGQLLKRSQTYRHFWQTRASAVGRKLGRLDRE